MRFRPLAARVPCCNLQLLLGLRMLEKWRLHRSLIVPLTLSLSGSRTFGQVQGAHDLRRVAHCRGALSSLTHLLLQRLRQSRRFALIMSWLRSLQIVVEPLTKEFLLKCGGRLVDPLRINTLESLRDFGLIH